MKLTGIPITQYGKSKKVGGWDPQGDDETDKGFGAWGNLLTLQGCALSDKAVAALGIKRLGWLTITFPNGTALCRQYQDRAPEDDIRVDVYEPWGFVVNRPDRGDVALTPMTGD